MNRLLLSKKFLALELRSMSSCNLVVADFMLTIKPIIITPVYRHICMRMCTSKSRLAIRVFNFLVHHINAKRLNDVTRYETVVILK